ncbi:MAG: hypothetical protein ACRERS_10895, partial [Methylococcales bacterium]
MALADPDRIDTSQSIATSASLSPAFSGSVGIDKKWIHGKDSNDKPTLCGNKQFSHSVSIAAGSAMFQA